MDQWDRIQNPEIDPHKYGEIIFGKVQLNEGNIVFSTNVAGTIGYPQAKDEPWPKSHSLHKIYSSGSSNYMSYIKPLEKKHRRFLGPRARQRDFRLDTQSISNKEKIDQLDLNQRKNIGSGKDPARRMKKTS